MREATCATCDGGPCPHTARGRRCETYVFRINRRGNMTCEECDGRGWIFNEERGKDHVCDACGGLGTTPEPQAATATQLNANINKREIVVTISGDDFEPRGDVAGLIYEYLNVLELRMSVRAPPWEQTRLIAKRLRALGVNIRVEVEPRAMPTWEPIKWKRP